MTENKNKKLVCLMPVDLMDKVDEYAALLHINRTAAVNVLVSRALQYEEIFSSMPKILQAVEDLKEQGETK